MCFGDNILPTEVCTLVVGVYRTIVTFSFHLKKSLHKLRSSINQSTECTGTKQMLSNTPNQTRVGF